ncbi:flagellar basal body rod protein FlgF [Sphingoaurantiacus capsulatus]|uniref:Flagellar basal-body rod protein FlgF n=1 Tax=Sphingoaurantiacus capsulatus TaxID=1771310 RepID=A0ABV7XDX2_9SPHN
MDKVAYTSLSALRGAMQRQAAIAHNLANASTTGFRAEMSSVRSLWVQGGGLESRAPAAEEVVAADMKAGTIAETGRDLDIAVVGNQLIAVQGPEGDEAYTRRGDLLRADTGLLTTGDGHPVIGNQGPITLPPADSVKIDPDGKIWIVPVGGDPNVPQEIDRLKLASADGFKVKKSLDGLFRVEGEFGTVLPGDPTAKLQPKSLEGSNVDVTKALVDMIEASRAWDQQVKLISSAQEIDVSAVDLMRLD